MNQAREIQTKSRIFLTSTENSSQAYTQEKKVIKHSRFETLPYVTNPQILKVQKIQANLNW